jgi:pantoate--beta-alanine ligase
VTAVVDDLARWHDERAAQRRAALTLGFVPTMGALHEGHLSLVRRSRQECDRTLVSIFVNPTQFTDDADFAKYPRDVGADIEMLRREGVDFVLVPAAPHLYPDDYRYRVTETALSRTMEGVHRPGHFDGVLTVVLKLLQIAAAERAYFGEKDWQQLTLVRGLVEAFFVPTVIVGCPTIREPDGLAMSSRNQRLSPADRRRASRLFQVLRTAASDAEAVRVLREAGFEVDYVEHRDGRRLAAVHIGGVRLIDNVMLGERS